MPELEQDDTTKLLAVKIGLACRGESVNDVVFVCCAMIMVVLEKTLEPERARLCQHVANTFRKRAWDE